MTSAADPAHIAELFSAFGPITVRRMFGGSGLFVDGMMMGLVFNGVIYLKADERTIPVFEREGLGPFSYPTKTGIHTITSYWRMPERLYDDPEELARWAVQALETARRKSAHAKTKPVRQRKGKPASRRQRSK